jgi:CYTH domain-containing protein
MSMETPKYALLEHERRFLVLNPPDLAAAPARLIEDVYLDCGRLRLRRITHFDGSATELKLCKKYASADPASAPIVNVYLSPDEFAALTVLPGRPVRKRRYRVLHGERGFGLDVFEGNLAGLILVEAEAASADEVRSVTFPPWAAAEVTADPFFTGGNLARIGAAELRLRLARRAELAAQP